MSDLQDRLAESLHRHADPVSAGPGLAQAAHRQALRLRLKRRIAAGVACLVALAVAVPVGYNLLGGPTRTEIAPIETPSVKPVETPPAKPVKTGPVVGAASVTIDLGKLSKGDAPRIAWAELGTIHDAGGKIVPLKATDQIRFQPVVGGYIVTAGTLPNESTALFGKDGEKIRDLPTGGFFATSDVAISPDGRRLAWVENADEDGGDLVLGNSAGQELGRKRIDGGVRPIGFYGDQVVFGARSAGSTGGDSDGSDGSSGLWDQRSGKVTRLRGVALGYRSDGYGRVVGQTPSLDDDESCQHVFDLGQDNRDLWQECTFSLDAQTADGRYTLGLDAAADPGRPSAALFDSATGERVRVFNLAGGQFQTITVGAFEPGGSLLLAVVQGDETQAIVRCELDGHCELATDVVRIPQGADGPAYPYRLPGGTE